MNEFSRLRGNERYEACDDAMPPNRHAVLSASSSHRWLHCNSSARLELEFEDRETEAAAEGTAAHALAEHKLRKALSAAAAFITPELLELPDETLEDDYRQCPALEVYRWHIYNIRRQKAHTLSKAEERLLAAAGEMANAPDTIYSMLADADLTFPDVQDAAGAAHPLTQGTYVSYLESTDRTLRKNAFTAMYQVYGGVQNTCAAVLAAQVKQLQFFAASRRYASPLEAALDSTHVPVSVYENLIQTVHENLDKLHRLIAFGWQFSAAGNAQISEIPKHQMSIIQFRNDLIDCNLHETVPSFLQSSSVSSI